MFYNAAMFLKEQSMTHQVNLLDQLGYDVAIRLMEMPQCFDKGHHLFTDNFFTTYGSAAYLLKRQVSTSHSLVIYKSTIAGINLS